MTTTHTDPTAGAAQPGATSNRTAWKDGAILHAREVGHWWILLMDHMLDDGSRDTARSSSTATSTTSPQPRKHARSPPSWSRSR